MLKFVIFIKIGFPGKSSIKLTKELLDNMLVTIYHFVFPYFPDPHKLYFLFIVCFCCFSCQLPHLTIIEKEKGVIHFGKYCHWNGKGIVWLLGKTAILWNDNCIFELITPCHYCEISLSVWYNLKEKQKPSNINTKVNLLE